MTIEFKIEVSELDFWNETPEEIQRRLWTAYNAGHIGFKADLASFDNHKTRLTVTEITVK